MILNRKVLLKAVVTEALKAELLADAAEAISRIDASLDEIQRTSTRLMLEMQRTDMQRAMQFRQQVELERRRYEEAKRQIEERRKMIEGLELGREVVRGTLESQVEVAPGDNLNDKLGRAEILVRDGLIEEIRDPAPEGGDDEMFAIEDLMPDAAGVA